MIEVFKNVVECLERKHCDGWGFILSSESSQMQAKNMKRSHTEKDKFENQIQKN